jgi:NADH-quinone oxidoreductase subunit J
VAIGLLPQIVFYFFAALAIVSAILVVVSRNAIHSAIFLITSLLATAGIYLQLEAEFLFVVQIILYVGGIMVLFVFVIMLVNLEVSLHQIRFNRQWFVATVLAVVLGLHFSLPLWLDRSVVNLPPPVAATMQPNSEMIGQALFQTYMLPFEITSILLLVAMIGAVVMAKRRI